MTAKAPQPMPEGAVRPKSPSAPPKKPHSSGVWVLIGVSSHDSDVLGVFTSEALANKAKGGYQHDGYMFLSVREFTLNELSN